MAHLLSFGVEIHYLESGALCYMYKTMSGQNK